MKFQNGHTPWNKGMKNCFSEEALERMSATHKGVPFSPLHRARISDATRGEKHWHYGIPMSDGTKEKLRKANTGKHHSEDAKQKLSVAHKHHYRDTCMCVACRNRRGNKDEMIVPWHKGKTGVYTKEALQKMSDAHKGKHHSDATKILVSEIVRKRNRSQNRKGLFDDDGRLILPRAKHSHPIDIAVRESMHPDNGGASVLPQKLIDDLYAKQSAGRIEKIKKAHADKKEKIKAKRHLLTSTRDLRKY